MRILVANDGVGTAGGVQQYLEAVVPGLQARGHELRVLHTGVASTAAAAGALSGVPQIGAAVLGIDEAIAEAIDWNPDLAFSHNMQNLDLEQRLIESVPVVKFMHGYFGTCLSGLKTHGFPKVSGCDRTYGSACLALYYPRRCGPLAPAVAFRQWRWMERQRTLLPRYHRIVVASEHMRDEYVRSGGDPSRVITNPLFASKTVEPACASVAEDASVAFMGRMTTLKGGDLLIRSVHHATRVLKRAVRVTMIGDGPQRSEWESLANSLGVASAFTGWVDGDDRWSLLQSASVIAIPSVWPEPFGLVGLEAGVLGIPAIAVDTGGIHEWLRPGVNGVLVAAPASSSSFGDALVRVLSDRPALERLRTGARRVAGEMTLEHHLDRLESTFGSTPAGPRVS